MNICIILILPETIPGLYIFFADNKYGSIFIQIFAVEFEIHVHNVTEPIMAVQCQLHLWLPYRKNMARVHTVFSRYYMLAYAVYEFTTYFRNP